MNKVTRFYNDVVNPFMIPFWLLAAAIGAGIGSMFGYAMIGAGAGILSIVVLFLVLGPQKEKFK